MRTQQGLLLTTLLMIGGVALALLVLQPFPVLHDYPEWMYQGWLFGQLLSADTAVTGQYALVDHPVPNSLSQFAIGALSLVLPAVTAARLWLALYLCVAAWLLAVLWRRNADGTQVFLLLTVVVLGPGFWNGYINFQCALLLFATYLLCSRRQLGYTLVFSLLIFFSHAAVFAVMAAYCVATALFDRTVTKPARIQLLLALIPSLSLLVWYTLALLATYQGSGSASMGFTEWAQYKFYTVAKQGPFHNFILPSGESLLESFDMIYWLGFAANFLFAIGLLLWLLWLIAMLAGRTQNPLRNKQGGSVLVLAVCIGFCLAVFALTGANTFGVVNLGERFLIVALMLSLLYLRMAQALKVWLAGTAIVVMAYLLVATLHISRQAPQQYSVERSSDTTELADYVDDIYASSRHQYFNHRLFIYADRGLELLKPEPALLEIDLETSVIRRLP